MKKDKLREHFFAILLLFIALFDFIVLNQAKQRIIFAIILAIYTLLCVWFIRPKRTNNVQKKYIIGFVAIFSIIFVALLYIIGLFSSFYQNPYMLGFKVLFDRLLPYTTLIILSELIRKCFITRENKLSKVLVTIALILVEMSIYNNLNGLNTLEDYLTFLGYILMSSVSVNLFCNYISKKYGMIPNLIYRLTLMGYQYIFPILPDVYLFFQSTLRIIYPYIMYLVIDSSDASYALRTSESKGRNFEILPYIAITFMCGFVMLVSCKFKYGIIAIGSTSMSDFINKGDAIIYERYDSQQLQQTDIIVFMNDGKRVIHRIDDVIKLKTKEIYHTKGDANQQRDEGYREASDIIGIYKCKVSNIGWPVVWLNEFSN